MDPYKNLKDILAAGKLLAFCDIETTPIKVRVWRPGKQVIRHDQIVEGENTKIITIQWMFEGDKKVSYLTWNKKHDDRLMLRKFVKIISQAKAVVMQNGDNFDIKVLQWRLNVLNLPPLPQLVTLDTLKLSRQAFAAPSHRLDYRSKVYGLGGKVHMDWQDWLDVMASKPGALEKMVKYGCKDVADSRAIFWKELPYYKQLPISLAALVKVKEARMCCPKCASRHQRKFDIYPTKIDNKLRYKCNNCSHIWRDTRRLPGGLL